MKLKFEIDTLAEDSIHHQIQEQIGIAIDGGCLVSGEFLPDLAELGRNLRAVLGDLEATYETLRGQGLLDEQEGRPGILFGPGRG